ncbi:hypothetical protein QDF31_000497 [Escherichia coli]|nr:hypothetical protein [Escherichia coli]
MKTSFRERITALDIDCSTALILQAIAQHADQDGKARISREGIAAYLRIKPEFVNRVLMLAIADGYLTKLKDGFLLNIPELPEKPAPEPNLPQEIAQSISNIRDWYFAKDALLQQRHQIAIDEVEAAEQRKQQEEEARARCKQAIANMLERAKHARAAAAG